MSFRSVGGFAAVVRISRSTTTIGLGHDRAFRTSAQMELEGELLECHYRDLDTRLTRRTKTWVAVDIDFSENPDPTEYVQDYAEGEDRYVGTIQLGDRVYDREFFQETDDTEVWAIVRLVLPLSAFQLLVPLIGRELRVDTVHDLIQSPTDDQKTDHVIAFVKRILFEPVLDPTPCRHAVEQEPFDDFPPSE
jgi:hypothetical protein